MHRVGGRLGADAREVDASSASSGARDRAQKIPSAADHALCPCPPSPSSPTLPLRARRACYCALAIVLLTLPPFTLTRTLSRPLRFHLRLPRRRLRLRLLRSKALNSAGACCSAPTSSDRPLPPPSPLERIVDAALVCIPRCQPPACATCASTCPTSARRHGDMTSATVRTHCA